MKFVVPVTVLFGCDATHGNGARDQLERVITSPMVGVLAQSRGIPFAGVSVDRAFVASSGAPCCAIYCFLDAHSDAHARQVWSMLKTMLQDDQVRQMLRASGVPFEAVNVGEPSAYQPPR